MVYAGSHTRKRKLTYPSEEGNVEAGSITVDKLEGKQLEDQGIIILGLCAVIFCHGKNKLTLFIVLSMHTGILSCLDIYEDSATQFQFQFQLSFISATQNSDIIHVFTRPGVSSEQHKPQINSCLHKTWSLF